MITVPEMWRTMLELIREKPVLLVKPVLLDTQDTRVLLVIQVPEVYLVLLDTRVRLDTQDTRVPLVLED